MDDSTAGMETEGCMRNSIFLRLRVSVGRNVPGDVPKRHVSSDSVATCGRPKCLNRMDIGVVELLLRRQFTDTESDVGSPCHRPVR